MRFEDFDSPERELMTAPLFSVPLPLALSRPRPRPPLLPWVIAIAGLVLFALLTLAAL